MPLLTLSVSKIPDTDYNTLISKMTSISSTITGKLESQIMTTLSYEEFFMAGKSQPSAFIEYKYIGELADDIKSKMSQELSTLLNIYAKVPLTNIYLNFTSVERSNWGVSKGIL